MLNGNKSPRQDGSHTQVLLNCTEEKINKKNSNPPNVTHAVNNTEPHLQTGRVGRGAHVGMCAHTSVHSHTHKPLTFLVDVVLRVAGQ